MLKTWKQVVRRGFSAAADDLLGVPSSPEGARKGLGRTEERAGRSQDVAASLVLSLLLFTSSFICPHQRYVFWVT